MNKIPIIIDCDPGVDDSYAIALANSCELFEIKAITAVEGNVPADVTRNNALNIAEQLKINCRVGFGAEKPLKKEYTYRATDTHGTSGVGDVVFGNAKRQPDPLMAWDIIYDEAVKHKGELILFAIGPLTNIAITLQKHPDLPKYLKKFCIMGGGTFGNIVSTGKTAEFNIWTDPHAARYVFERMEVYMVGLDATYAAALSGSDFDDMITLCSNGKNAAFIKALSEFSKRNSEQNGRDSNIIHDALAVASVMDESVVTFEPYYVYVEDEDEKHIGQTVIDLDRKSGKAPNCHVAVKADKHKFAKMLKDMCRYYSER